MSGPNWKNRTLFHGDNLKFLRAMNSESVDLIATDPPFNKNRDFHATPDSLAAGAKFQDRWSWEKDVHEEWVDEIKDDHPRLMEAIESARYAHSDGMGAYMCFMAVRLLAMRRVLKSTGSIYLHCDPTASHYLKACMDAIFGWKQFQNEIVWNKGYRGTPRKNRYQQEHDIILFYANGRGQTWNKQTVPYKDESLGRYNKVDEDGKRYALIKRRRTDGTIYYGKCYPQGKLIGDVITLPTMASTDKERTGYPTQKPLALYERIISASTNKGDIVLDPFCGCATTLVAAEGLDRQWAGIDIWEGAHELVIKRLKDKSGLFGDVTFTKELPERTDAGDTSSPFLQVKTRRYGFATEAWQRLSRNEIVKELADAQRSRESGEERLVLCAGCGRSLEPEFMELDHVQPRSDGGANDISNRILLCGPCNRRKRHTLAMPGLHQENKKAGWMHDFELAKRSRELAKERADDVRHRHSEAQNELALD